MTTKIIIIGTGGNSIDVAEIIEEISILSNENKYEILGYLDDDEKIHQKNINGYSVLGGLSLAKQLPEEVNFVFTIGSERSYKNRLEIIRKIDIDTKRFINIIHPSARVSKSSILGIGNIIFPNVTICSNVIIGDFTIILSGSVINHDCILKNNNILASCVNLSGGVQVKESCYIGASASIRNGVILNQGTLVGMGSVVIKDTPENVIIVGNPSRILDEGKI
ncbi:acetyltransferase [Solibacillus silvestris]|uniref:acetyltransferase n=1 Tax=Solibacillus silvestris TaxID=76853 RepID=UPI003F81557A